MAEAERPVHQLLTKLRKIMGIKDLIANLKQVANKAVEDWKAKPSNQISNAIVNSIIPTRNGVPGNVQLENIPQVSVPKFNFATTPLLQVPQFVLNLPSSIAEGVVNAPGNFVKGIARTSNDLGSMSEGKIPFSPFKLASDPLFPLSSVIL